MFRYNTKNCTVMSTVTYAMSKTILRHDGMVLPIGEYGTVRYGMVSHTHKLDVQNIYGTVPVFIYQKVSFINSL